MTTIRTSEPFLSTPNDSPAYWLLDILWVVHATGEQTQGRYSMIEQWMPNDAFAPPHVHPNEDESFWILEGEMTVKVGGKTLVLGPGSLGHVPRNHVHSFKVTGKTVCHILNYYSPAGFEQTIIGSARPAERREMPPRGMDPHDSPQVVRYFNNFDQRGYPGRRIVRARSCQSQDAPDIGRSRGTLGQRRGGAHHVAGAGSDFEAVEKLRRLAFADQVEEPQPLSLWQTDAGQAVEK
jgi:mannose-6-phosphate isomerase-like protein (cupin superfamily)